MSNDYRNFFKNKNIDLLEDLFFQEVEGAAFFIVGNRISWKSEFHFLYNNLDEFKSGEIANFESLLSYFNRESEMCETEGANRCYDSMIKKIKSEDRTSIIFLPILKDGKTFVFRLKIVRFIKKGVIFGFLNLMDDKGINYEKLIASSFKDSLTGLFNRNTYYHHLEMAKSGKHFIGFMDLDNFKDINDTYSHEQGDKMLKEIANVLINSIANENVIFYRIGGDEFLFFTNGYNKAQTDRMINKIKKSIRKLKFNDYIPTFSIGYFLADFDKNIVSKDHLVNLADLAMYESKKTGKDSVTYLSEEKIINILKSNSVEKKLLELRKRTARVSDKL